MHATLGNCHKLIYGCRYHHVFSFDKKFDCTLTAEGAFDNPIGRRYYLFDEVT